ncbi:hypothetical protein J7E73_27030 [Paenibacillus albidus]|uniref:hypothetical protein n=1 Tax=Paenibacillus albidus TaxID=2041023 RepID=UPI001BE6E1FF|nr:hypothetical protein [Paenibacillus albidus]MBT2292719.1 hypothetical protein [Paenibacillus albidus]
MHEHRGKLRKHCWRSLMLLFFVMMLLSACGRNSGEGISPEYNGVKYTGEGTLETKVNVVIFNEDEVLFLQTVKIIDDRPTVWKALQAISGNAEQGMPIEKNQEGQITKVDGIENNENNQWELSINNVFEAGNTEEIAIDEEQPLTLRNTARP